jgi:galactokinase
VQADATERFSQSVAVDYQAATGLTPNLYVCKATNGAELVMG